MKFLAAFLILLVNTSAIGQTPSGEEVLKRIDDNMVIDQAIQVTTMIVHSRSGTRTITSRAWVKGEDKSLVEYLSPPREKGKKMLKDGDMLWTYTPEPSDRIITISGHLLRQSVMGSDLSYEDMMENREMLEMYNAEVTGSETLAGRPCWVLQLTARESDIAYHSRKIWVDKERWLPLKEERYAKSGKLLKNFTIDEVFRVEGRWFPKKMTFKDMLSSGKGTEYIIDSIDFHADIPDYLLTKAALRR